MSNLQFLGADDDFDKTVESFEDGEQQFITLTGNSRIIIAVSGAWPSQPDDTAKRLVTCWNACQGLTTENLESVLTVGDTLASRFKARDGVEAELTKQRDELLAALKDARELVDGWGAYASNYMQEKHDLAGDIKRLSAAITKVEG